MQLIDTFGFILCAFGLLSVGHGYSALLQHSIPKSEEVVQSLNLADSGIHFGLPRGLRGNDGTTTDASSVGPPVTTASSVGTTIATASATDPTVAAAAPIAAMVENATNSNLAVSNFSDSEIFVLRTTSKAEQTTTEAAAELVSTARSTMFGGVFKFGGGGLLGNLISGSGGESQSLSASPSRSRYRGRGGYGSGSGYGSSNGVQNSTNGLLSMFEIATFPPTTTEKPLPPGNFDKHLDSIIVNLGTTLRKNGFDPINVGNILQCSNCTLEGLSLIRRSGPSNFVYANRTVTVDAHLTLPVLYISCFPCVDVILMVPLSGMLEVALWGLKIYGKVSQPTSRGASPSLITYRVEHEGELDIGLNGRGILAPITEFGFKVIRQRQVSDLIREFVYERVPKFIRRRLKDFTFPIGK